MKKLSAISLFVCYAAMFVTGFFYYPKWEQQQTEATLSWDVSGYYMYLPAIFIYKDLKHCGFKDSILAKYQPTPNFQQAFIHKESGNYVMKYSSGQAILMSPFFLAAHVYAKQSKIYPADGFSLPYQKAIGIGMFLYALLGVLMVRKVLLQFFSDATTAICLLAIVLGTDYLNYASIDQALTHSTLFTLYTFVLYFSIQFYKQPRYKTAIAIGLLCGFATLIRPSEGISFLIPLLWGLSTVQELKERLQFILAHIKKYILAVLAFISVAGIQLFYWKYVSGHFLVYSYEDQTFHWTHPHSYDFAFNFGHGWLIYTPMMLLALIGFIPLWFKKNNRLVFFIFCLLNYYIISAWQFFDYSGHSGRAIIQNYPLLAFPLSTLVEWVNKRSWSKLLFYPTAVLFAYINIWWMHNAHRGKVPITYISKAFYFKYVGRFSYEEKYLSLIDNPFLYNRPVQAPTSIYTNDFENDTSDYTKIIDGNRYAFVDKDHLQSPLYALPAAKVTKKWLRVSADFSCAEKEWETWNQTQFTVKYYDQGKEIQSNMIRVFRFLSDNSKRRLSIDTKVPKKKFDSITVSFWNVNSQKELLIDNMEAITFDK